MISFFEFMKASIFEAFFFIQFRYLISLEMKSVIDPISYLPSTHCQFRYRIKRPNDSSNKNSFCFISIQGETHPRIFTNDDDSISKPITEFQPNIDWSNLPMKTLAIMELSRSLFGTVFDGDERWLGPWIWSRYAGEFSVDRTYWSQVDDKIYLKNDELSIQEAIKLKRAAPPWPTNLVDVIFTDIRRECGYNPIFHSLLVLTPFTVRFLDKEFSSARRITINQLKLANFYDPSKTDEYYNRLIDKYSWSNVDELKSKIEMFYSSPCDEVFDDVTYESFELLPKTREFFHSIKFRDYSFDSTAIFNDVIAVNELERALDCSDIEFVLIYGGSAHMSSYVSFLTRYYKDWTYKRCYDWLKNEALKYAKKNNVITINNDDKFLSKIAKLCDDVMQRFDYDSCYFSNIDGTAYDFDKIQECIENDIEIPETFKYKKCDEWKLKTIEEIEKTNIWVCHDSAYYMNVKIQEIIDSMKLDAEIHRYCKRRAEIDENYKNRTHGFSVLKYNSKFYTIDCCNSVKAEFRGPFKSLDEALNEQLVRGNYGKHEMKAINVDNTKPGDGIEAFL